MVIEASLKVYLAAVCTLLGPICFGIAIGYSSPAFETLLRINGTEGKENSRNRIASKTDGSLISAAITLGALLGSLAGGFISQTLGRKKALVIYGLPYATGCAIIFFAKSVPVIVTGRFITGIITGMICTAAPTYIVEISTPKTRGLLGTSFQLCIVTGIFIMSVFGIFSTKEFNYFFNWRYLALIGIMPSLALSITMFFMPESPAWLLSRYGRSSLKPEKALTKLRTPNSDIQKELNEINEVISESKSVLITFEELKKPEVWKPLLLGIGLMFFQQFSGINVVMFFQTQILEEAGASSPAVGTALTCFAQLASTFVGAYIMDKLGRRKLLLISGGGHTASLFTLGLYFYFREKQEIELNFIPVVCLIVYIVAFAIGYGPVAWLMIPEMTPTTARSFVSTITTTINWIGAFICSFSFEYLRSSIGNSSTFWLYSMICAISCGFVLFCLPETKGKTFEEIQRIFTGKNLSSSFHLNSISQKTSIAKTDFASLKIENTIST